MWISCSYYWENVVLLIENVDYYRSFNFICWEKHIVFFDFRNFSNQTWRLKHIVFFDFRNFSNQTWRLHGNPRTIHGGYSIAMARAAGAARGGSEIHCVMRAAIDYKNMV